MTLPPPVRPVRVRRLRTWRAMGQGSYADDAGDPHQPFLAGADLAPRPKARRSAASPYAGGFLLRREERARAGGGGGTGTCWDLADRPAWEVAAVRRREERDFARENWERECAQRNRAWAGLAPGARLAMLREARRDPREFIETAGRFPF